MMDLDDPEPFMRLLSDDQLSAIYSAALNEVVRRGVDTGEVAAVSAAPYSLDEYAEEWQRSLEEWHSQRNYKNPKWRWSL